MIHRQQIFLRAQDETGRFGAADILDLDEQSFRAFVVRVLFDLGAVVGIRDEHAKGDPVPMRTRAGFRFPVND